jgi:hypothetical protein
MRTPKSNRKRTAAQTQELEDDLSSSTKRVCEGNQMDIFNDSQSFVDAVLSTNMVTVEVDVHRDSTAATQMARTDDHRSDKSGDIVCMIAQLSSDMHNKFGEVHATMDKIAKDIETNVTKKLTQILDKRVTAEVKKIKTDVQRELDDAQFDFRQDLKNLEGQLDEIRKKTHDYRDSTRDMNIIIRNLPESVGENLESKVQGLMKDGIKLRVVGFSGVVRKGSRQRGKPGVVVMTCRSAEDKQ